MDKNPESSYECLSWLYKNEWQWTHPELDASLNICYPARTSRDLFQYMVGICGNATVVLAESPYSNLFARFLPFSTNEFIGSGKWLSASTPPFTAQRKSAAVYYRTAAKQDSHESSESGRADYRGTAFMSAQIIQTCEKAYGAGHVVVIFDGCTCHDGDDFLDILLLPRRQRRSKKL
jgi:hypothetical protein